MSTVRTERLSPIALIGFIAAFVALLMVGGAGPAYRLNLLDLGGAFALLRWGAWTGLVVALIALVGAWITRPGTPRRGFALALAGVVIAAAAFCVPFAMLQSAKASPPIHDITTDMENPPRFVAVVALRTGSANPVEYQGESIAQQQRKEQTDAQHLERALGGLDQQRSAFRRRSRCGQYSAGLRIERHREERYAGIDLRNNPQYQQRESHVAQMAVEKEFRSR